MVSLREVAPWIRRPPVRVQPVVHGSSRSEFADVANWQHVGAERFFGTIDFF